MKPEQYKYELSVIIPTYNRSTLLTFTLDSLVMQDIGKNSFEVVIADDGSTDNTKEVAESYSKKLNLKYVYQEDKGYRPASARNKGIRASEGRVCVFVDSSVILNTNCLRSHIDFYRNKPSKTAAIGYVYGFDHNEKSEEILRRLVVPSDPRGSIKRLSHYPVYLDVRDPFYEKHNYRLDNLHGSWYYFWTCHVSVLRSELIEIDLFDEQYDGRWGGEDNDLAFRLCANGVKIYLLREAEAIHYPHGKDKVERQKDGLESVTFFHNKFQSPESKIFMDTYMLGLIDIHELISAQLYETAS